MTAQQPEDDLRAPEGAQGASAASLVDEGANRAPDGLDGAEEPRAPQKSDTDLRDDAKGLAFEDGTSEDDVLEATLGAPSLSAALEAILLVTDEPIDVTTLAALVRRPAAEVGGTLARLADDYVDSGRGFELREVAGGWRFYTSVECAEIVERYVRDGQQARLTQAALETLAVVAYRQPVSRARISAVRGVNVDGVIRTLTGRGLIAEAGHDTGSGAILYRTTELFLERLGIRSLEELPPVADYLPEIEMLDDFIEQTSS